MWQGVQNTASKLTIRMHKNKNWNSNKAAIPNLTSALSVNNTFCPLMSLCMTWFWWRWLTPCTNAHTMKRKVRFQKTNLHLVIKITILAMEELTLSTSWQMYEIHSSFNAFPLEAAQKKDAKCDIIAYLELIFDYHATILFHKGWPRTKVKSAYRVYSNKRHGAYLIFHATSAALIRGWRLFKGGAYLNIVPDKFTFSIFLFNGTLSRSRSRSRKQAVCASNRKTKERSWACCAGKVHGSDIRASHSKNSGKRAYRPSREIQSLWTKEHHI